MIYALIALVLLVIVYISIYNGFVKNRTWIEESWAQIDVQLKRRYDLIPNLVETVKGYAKHEKDTLNQVIAARNQLLNTSSVSREEVMEQNNQLSGALKSIFALSESYPDLKANQNYLMLQEELSGTENKIAYARQLYNSTVAKYNIKVQTVPSNIVANIHHFEKQAQLEVPKEEREPIKVSF